MSESTNTWNSFKKGDKSALEQIYTQNFDALLGYGCGFADIEVVKDNIQELFVKLYLNRESVGECSNIRFYLLRALKNRLLDYKKNRKIELTDRITDDFVFEIDGVPEEMYDDENLRNINKIKSLFNELSPRQREILYLRYIDKMPYNEIADLLHIECQSAKNLFVRSVAKIKENFFK